tara:strand:+ start:377 stop:661 length:285 start_codon:yes stop_codon:yes gene_type:complete
MLHVRATFSSQPLPVDEPSGNGRLTDILIVTIFPFNRFLLTDDSTGKDYSVLAGKDPCSEKNRRFNLHSENRDVEFSGEIFLQNYRSLLTYGEE